MNKIEEKTDAVSTKPKDKFIEYLEGLTADAKNTDRAALANLRSGLRRKNFQAMEMYPYLGRFLSEKSGGKREEAIFIVAALFAYYYYPNAPKTSGNLGLSLRQLSDNEKKDRNEKELVSKSIEKRFVALLNADAEDLPNHLRQIIGLLKSKEIGVNWQRLFDAVRQWSNDNRHIQRDLARSFWGDFRSEEKPENLDTETTLEGEQI